MFILFLTIISIVWRKVPILLSAFFFYCVYFNVMHVRESQKLLQEDRIDLLVSIKEYAKIL